VDLRGLRVVVAVADYGTLTAAAESLHLSPSALSHALARTEASLGVDLFHRLPRGMALTDAGKAVLGPARRALREVELAREAAGAVQGVLRGELSIVSVRIFSVPLASVVARFSLVHPGVVVRVESGETEPAVARSVESGRCDIGFSRSRGVPAGLSSEPVMEEHPVLVVPAGHPLARRTVVTIDDLAGERMVVPSARTRARSSYDHLFRTHNVDIEVVAEGATHEMVLELVRAGIGCTVTAGYSVGPVVGRGAVAVTLEGLPPSIVVIVRRHGELTPAARAFWDLARHILQQP
jgi:DNA-binding transcriptional LysR family regulator